MYTNKDLSISVLYINRDSLGCAQNISEQNATGESATKKKRHLDKMAL